MATEDTLGARYEMRRRARGTEPPPEHKAWRRRIIAIGASAAAVIILVVAVVVWWTLTHVGVARATVAAAVIGVPANVEARMSELLARPHDQVQADQPLAILDDPQVKAALDAAEATLALNESLYSQAQAEEKVTKVRVESDLESAQAAVDAAKARVAQAEAALTMRDTQFAEEVRRADAERDQARAELASVQKGAREEEVQAAQARLDSAKALQSLYELEVHQSEQLVVEGIDSQYILETRKTRLTQQQKAVREAELMLQRLRKGATPEELEAGTQAAAAKEAASAAVKAGDKAIQNLREELTVRKAELRQAEAQLRGADVRQVDVQLAQEKVKAAKAALERAQSDVAAQRAALTIRSPVTGTVIRVFNRVGDTCRKGIDVFQVTDDAKGRWISAFVREKDAFYIEPGQRAKVKLASGEKVNAEVEEVGGATSSLDRQRANPLGESEQLGPELVHIRLKPLEPLKSDPIPGMSARATIRIR